MEKERQRDRAALSGAGGDGVINNRSQSMQFQSFSDFAIN